MYVYVLSIKDANLCKVLIFSCVTSVVFGDLLSRTLNYLRSCRVLTSGRTQGTRGTNSQPQSSGLPLTAEPTVAGEQHEGYNRRGEYSGNVIVKHFTKSQQEKRVLC
jgi:hypothetical protein